MSTSTATPKETPAVDHVTAAHEPFSWLAEDAQDYPMADFVALTLDVSTGIHTCLEIINSSDLIRSANEGAPPGEAVLPAVNMFDAEHLLRLSMATARLLRLSAEHNIRWINKYGAKRYQAMKDAAE